MARGEPRQVRVEVDIKPSADVSLSHKMAWKRVWDILLEREECYTNHNRADNGQSTGKSSEPKWIKRGMNHK